MGLLSTSGAPAAIMEAVFKAIVFSGIVTNLLHLKYESNGFFYTYDDDYSNPGVIKTEEVAAFYPQAGIHFLVGMNLKF